MYFYKTVTLKLYKIVQRFFIYDYLYIIFNVHSKIIQIILISVKN